MRERPILFSDPMVRAILAGTKTQTRRVVKPQPSPELLADYAEIRDRYGSARTDAQMLSDCVPCPYGQPGDRLWVRETFIGARGYDRDPPSRFGNKPIWYCADGEPDRAQWWQLSDRKRPSIHMPRWASRITLEVTGVRVERLQDISEADARAEGARCVDRATGREVMFPDESQHIGSWRLHFREIWESINGPGSWDANPWVWAIAFRRLEAGSDA